MKLFFSLFFLMVLTACIHFDRLEYYVDGYSPNNDSISTNGYYYQQSDSLYLEEWPDAIAEMYLLKNGTFIIGSNNENLDSLNTWMCKLGQEKFRYGPHGYYTVKNDTILGEFLYTEYFVVPLRAYRHEFKAVQTQNGLTIFEIDGTMSNEEWIFYENDCVPDSVKIWMTDHRKYKIDTE